MSDQPPTPEHDPFAPPGPPAGNTERDVAIGLSLLLILVSLAGAGTLLARRDYLNAAVMLYAAAYATIVLRGVISRHR